MKTAILMNSKNSNSIKVSKSMALVLTTVLSYIVFSIPNNAFSAEILKLKTNIEVQKDVVTLGDIFENMSRYRSEAIFKSPALGRQGTVRIERLIEAAERYDFTFDTPLDLKKIKISRPARKIKAETIKAMILEKIQKENEYTKSTNLNHFKETKTKLTFNPPLKAIMVPLDFSGELKFKNFTYNKFRGTFQAVIQPREANKRNFLEKLNGKTQTVVVHAVIKRGIKKGETIHASDVELAEFSPRRVPRNAIQTKKQLIGMIASKRLRAGSIIRSTDIEIRKIIKKDQLVTLVLQKPGLSLKTQGKAVTSASLNETITVMNIQSKRVIHGVVKGPGLVMVQTNNYQIKPLKTAQLN